MEESDARGWYARWEAQQDGMVAARAERFAVMLDVVEDTFGRDALLTVLDLACGPASIAVRVLERFPESRCVAVDLDPVLLAIGRGAHGDRDGRLTWVEHDLRDPAWVDAVRAGTSPRDGVDAVLTSTALHWVPTDALVHVYRGCAALVRPGGVLLDADNMDYSFATPTIRGLAEDRRSRWDRGATERSARNGFEEWEQWWDAVAASPGLAELWAERQRRFAWRDRSEYRPGLDVHRALLLEAGFREVDTVWQRYQNRVLLAVR